jgi:hypoxia up-regulated 1
MILSRVCTRQIAARVDRESLITFAGKLKGLFGDGSSSAEDGSASTVDSSSPSSSSKTTKSPASPKDTTVPLKVTVKFPSVAPMGLEQKREARQRYACCCSIILR